jgi:hypothetical protein
VLLNRAASRASGISAPPFPQADRWPRRRGYTVMLARRGASFVLFILPLVFARLLSAQKVTTLYDFPYGGEGQLTAETDGNVCGTIGTITLTNGQASINKAFAASGSKTITATCFGDVNFISSSIRITQTVQ